MENKMSSIFTKIIKREIPSEIVFEDEELIAFKDIQPAAPVHILIVTKKEIKDLQSLQPADYHLLSKIVQTAQNLARQFGIENGYRLLTNNGPSAGQTIFHLHFHLLGGKQLGALG
jgi:histidine triad (HIT) family protein